MNLMNITPLHPPVEPETVEHPDEGVTLESLAAFKHLSVSELRGHGCSPRKRDGRQVVAIPYLDGSGETVAVRYRTALCREPCGIDDRFRWRRGDRAIRLYGAHRLAAAQTLGWVLIVEGESDCWTAWHYGLPAVGVPGKTTWKPPMAEALSGLKIYVWQEPDAEDFVERIARDLPEIRIIVAPENLKDISAAHIAGRDVVALLEQLRASAVPFDRIQARRRDSRLVELEAAARPLLCCPDPVALIREALIAQGYGGDLAAPLLVYLATTGRVLAMRPGAMPVHLLLLGPASAGKSYTLAIVLALMPCEAYHVIDAGSPRTLIYDDAPLAHRVVIFAEADSLPAGEDNPAASAIRNLLQDHHLHYQVTVRDPQSGEFTVRKINKPGPTTLLTTSTRRLGAQLDTRLFCLEVPDDQAQTAQALRTQAALELAGGTPPPPNELLAFQSYLQASAPWEVVVPFAESLAAHLASQPQETRIVRDFARLLSLIKAATVICQAQRHRDERGRLVADLADYETVFELVAEIYRASSSGAGCKVREVVAAVADHLAKGHPHASQADIQLALGLSKASVSRRVGAAKRGRWLVDDETRKGHPAKLQIGEQLPSEGGLPSLEQLGCSTVSALTDASSDGLVAPSHDEPDHQSASEQEPEAGASRDAERPRLTGIAAPNAPWSAEL